MPALEVMTLEGSRLELAPEAATGVYVSVDHQTLILRRDRVKDVVRYLVQYLAVTEVER